MDAPGREKATGWGSRAAALLTRGSAAILLLVALAYPVRAFVLDPAGRSWVTLSWFALLALGVRLPLAGGLTLVAAVPLVPILTYKVRGVPAGAVHLLVLSQALPLLARVALGRARREEDRTQSALALFVLIGAVSAVVFYAGHPLLAFSAADFGAEMHRYLSGYLFDRTSASLSNPVLALSTLLDGFLAYAVVRTSTRGHAASAVRVAAGAAVAVAAFGVVQALTRIGLRGGWALYDPGIVRVNSTYTDPNALAAYLAMMIPVACAYVPAAARVWRRVAWLAAGLVLGVCLILTAGRAAYGAALVGLGAAAFLAVAWGLDRTHPSLVVRRHFRRVLIGGTLAVLLSLAGLATVGTLGDFRHGDQRSYLHTALYTLNLRQPFDEILKGRLIIWRAMALMIEQHPVFGSGVGTVFRMFPAYNQSPDGRFAGMKLSAHNTFLNVTAEMGGVGLIAWLVVLALVYRVALRPDPAAADRTGWTRAGLAGGLIAFGVTMLTGDRVVLREDIVMFAAMAALAASLAPPYAAPSRRLRLVAILTLVAVAVSLPVRAVAQARAVRLEKVAWGLGAREADRDGVPFRWSGAHFTIYVPAGARSFALPVRAAAPFPQRLRIVLDGEAADEVELIDHNWRTLRYLVPGRGRVRYHRLDASISPVWQPDYDPRTLGIMIGTYTWTP